MGLHDGHRQRKRQQFLSHGPQSMADHELLELALFYAIPRRDTNETAHRLLDRFGSLDRVLSAPEQELEQVEGVGQNAAVLLRLRRSQRYSALRLLPATVRLHTFTATAAATQSTRLYTRAFRTATLQCVLQAARRPAHSAAWASAPASRRVRSTQFTSLTA